MSFEISLDYHLDYNLYISSEFVSFQPSTYLGQNPVSQDGLFPTSTTQDSRQNADLSRNDPVSVDRLSPTFPLTSPTLACRSNSFTEIEVPILTLCHLKSLWTIN